MRNYIFSTIIASILAAAALAPAPRVVTLDFVGDIMLDRGVLLSVQTSGQSDFNWLFADLASLKNSDILFGNLEGPLSDQGEKVGSIYSFRMKPEAAATLASAGFDVLSLANNHIGDWGREAADDTVKRLEGVGITPVLSDLKILERNNLKIGFLAFSDVGPNWLSVSDKNLPAIIKTASKQVNHLIVSFHFGEEYQTRSNDRQKYLAHLAIDNGARLVIGSHPHVVEEVERYRDGLIAYSLGNFIFDQAFSPETMRGEMLEVKLDENNIISAQTRVSQQDSSFRPHLSLASTNV